jgi:hypothetical protein
MPGDPVHGHQAVRWGGWSWDKPRRGEHFRRCSYCGSIHPEDLAAEPAGGDACLICGKQGWLACFDNQEHAGIKAAVEAGDLAVSDEERARIAAMAAAHSYDPGGWYASWADRKYGYPHKFYVEGVANRNPGRLYVTSSTNAEDAPGALGGRPWVHRSKLSRLQKRVVAEYGGESASWFQFGTHQTHFVKFYTVHLADPGIRPDIKAEIERASGLKFTFEGGRVAWAPAG